MAAPLTSSMFAAFAQTLIVRGVGAPVSGPGGTTGWMYLDETVPTAPIPYLNVGASPAASPSWLSLQSGILV